MTKQNLNLHSAMEDIAVIRQTIEKSKIHFAKLATLFIAFGATQLCAYIIQQLGRMYFLENGIFTGVEFLYWLKYMTLAVLFGFFVKMRIDIKKSGNIYTLQLFDIWGLILFAVPLIRFLAMLVQTAVYKSPAVSNTAVFAYAAIGLIEYVSVVIGTLITGCILNKAELKVVALALLFIYPLLFFVGADTVNIDTVMAAYGHFSSVNAAAYIVTLVLYIVMGIDFKICGGGDKVGTE